MGKIPAGLAKWKAAHQAKKANTAIKPGSAKDKTMEKKMNIKPGSKADKAMEAGNQAPVAKKGGLVHFKKGSPEAKAFMAKLRAKKGKK